MMTEFRNNYREKFDIDFIGDIPCAAHVINLIVNDIMTALKLKAPKSDEIAIYINDIEQLSKKKGSNTESDEAPGTSKFFIKFNIFFFINMQQICRYQLFKKFAN